MSSPVEPMDPFWAPGGSTKLFSDLLVTDDEPVGDARTESSSSRTLNGKQVVGLLAASSYSAALQLPSSSWPSISSLEAILVTYPPVLDSLLAQLPTQAVFALSQTSRRLRKFLQSYPLAWKTLSFRLPQTTVVLGSPGVETPDPRERQTKSRYPDYLLIRVVVPIATRLTSLDLCNTAVSGAALLTTVLQRRYDTLQHLSVRGCKNVSIKYHIVPFLQLYGGQNDPWDDKKRLALKSLYTYRCRHHRRRPYLPSSLMRRDSDSEPTHDLIELCHRLGIWTDTAWCPTPGPRCFRRKDYHGNRAAPGTMEVWVPFDRLWRSSNRIGPAGNVDDEARKSHGKLWEEMETGQDGEPLGTGEFSCRGEGKDVPAHIRKSHTTYIDNVRCDDCGLQIHERCETCSIKMHCMGCRKTLCASCAFNRPIPKKRKLNSTWRNVIGLSDAPNPSPAASSPSSSSSPSKKKKTKQKFWWAPGATRSPNLMNEQPIDSDSDSDDTATNASTNLSTSHNMPLKLNMHWCCLEPIFSGGGGVAFLGPGLGGSGSDRIRAVPLPKTKEYEDPDFATSAVSPGSLDEMRKNMQMFEEIIGSTIDVLPYLQQNSLDLQAETCPRSLCQTCFRSFRWRVSCRACKKPICKEHDFRALKVRKCGFRDLNAERDYVRNPPKHAKEHLSRESHWPRDLQIPAFRPPDRDGSVDGANDEDRMSRAPGMEWEDSSNPEIAGTRAPSSTPSASPGPSSDRPTSMALAVTNEFDLVGSVSSLEIIDFADPSSSNVNASTVSSSSSIPNPLLRVRSASLSDLRHHLSSSSTSNSSTSQLIWRNRFRGGPPLGAPPPVPVPSVPKERLLLPCRGSHPVQWEGCGAYYCQSERPVGDCRGRCTAGGQECGDCGVYVCEICLSDLTPPQCTCTFCENHFFCPFCAQKPAVREKCLKEEEMRAKQREREQEKARKLKQKEERLKADEILSSVGEFWDSVGGPSNENGQMVHTLT